MKTAKWIRDHRVAAGLSQAELARQIGASQPMVSLWERGAADPSPDLLERLRSILGEPTATAPEASPRQGRTAAGGKAPSGKRSASSLDFELTLWAAVDRLRGSMNVSEYKLVVLGLVFLKYVSDAFEEQRARLTEDPEADPEDRDYYTAENIFWVPEEARWSGSGGIQARARIPQIGRAIDDAMIAVERENPLLKGVLPKDYNRPLLDNARLGELVDLVSLLGLEDAAGNLRPSLRNAFEYLLRILPAEGRDAGEFYTPHSLIELLVEILEPRKGRAYDPCFGLGGMLAQAHRFVRGHGARPDGIALYGQESNLDAWRLGKMNLAIQGIDANLGPQNADTLLRDLHPGLKADFILADPPFNARYVGGEQLREDPRWRFGLPPTGNANYAWIQHCIHHLSPQGEACLILPSASMSSRQSGEAGIRKRIVEDDLLACLVALPAHLHSLTSISVCLWCVTRTKAGGMLRDRRGEVLFIDARSLGYKIGRSRRELSKEDLARIAETYRTWRAGNYEDQPGFCRSVTIQEVAANEYDLHPQGYINQRDIIVQEALAQLDPTYIDLLEDLKSRIQVAQLRAVLAVNREMVLLYWQIGRQIVQSQEREGWGAKVIDRLADDLQRAFPAVEGFSARNLKYMRALATAWPDEAFVQEVLAQITWSHNIAILEKVKSPEEREYYVRQCIAHGWSRSVLVHHIESGFYFRQGKALTNFDRTLLPPQSDLAGEALKDPYIFDFLNLGPEARERDLEQALLVHVRDFLLEMGAGFALVGSQYHLQVGDRDFYLDLLFYHLHLRCFVIVDLKVGDFLPEHAGKMNFYLSAVDDLLRHPDDQPSIGLILSKTQNRLIAGYSLQGMHKPIGVATYRLMPEGLKDGLPSPEALEGLLRDLEE